MPDLRTLLREHYESQAPPINVDRLFAELEAGTRAPQLRTRNGLTIVVATALAVLVLAGGVLMLQRLFTEENQPVIEEPAPPTTIVVEPEETVPPPDPETPAPVPPTPVGVLGNLVTLDREGDAGSSPSIAIDSDGLLVVAYVATSAQDWQLNFIKLAHCVDPDCTEALLTTAAEAPRLANLEFALPADGNPVFLWSENPPQEAAGEEAGEEQAPMEAFVYKCLDPQCTSGTKTNIGEFWGGEIAVGADGLPVIVYGEDAGPQIMKCGDPACASGNVVRTAPELLTAWNPVFAIDSQSRPVIVGTVPDQDVLTVVACDDPACTSYSISTVDEASGFAPVAMVVDGAGRPVVALSEIMYGEGSASLAVLACADRICSAPSTLTPFTTHSGDGELGSFGDVAIADDGRIALVIQDEGVVVMSCVDSACTTGVTSVTVSHFGAHEYDIAYGSDGYPIVALSANSDLKVLVCTDPACAGAAVEPGVAGPQDAAWSTTVAVSGDVFFTGSNPTALFGPDGRLRVSHSGPAAGTGPEGETREAPHILICDSGGCSSNESVIVDIGVAYPAYHSMTLRPDGSPMLAFSNWDEGGIHVAACSDADCSDYSHTAVGEGWLWAPPAIAVRPNGRPVIAYQDGNDFYVDIVSCSDEVCSDATISRLDSVVDEDDMRWLVNTMQVVIPPDGLPVVALGQGNGEVRIAKCTDPECVSSTAIIADDSGLDGLTSMLAMGPDGVPLVAYYADGYLKVAACTDVTCGEVTVSTLSDQATANFISSVGPSIAFGPDGNPVIAFWTADRTVVLAGCNDAACTEADLSVFGQAGTFALAIDQEGSPVLAYYQVQPEAEPSEFQQTVDLIVARCSGQCLP